MSVVLLAFNIQPVKAEPRTWTVDDDGPADFHTIQEAINNASDGDTIFVYNGTYYENVVVNKTVLLVGEDPSTTIIDGGGIGDVVYLTAGNVVIKNFKIRNSGSYYAPPNSGIRMEASYCNITHNIVTNNSVGVYLYESSYNSIYSNNVTNKYEGIILHDSLNNNISGNNIIAHEYEGVILSWLSSNNVISGNNITNNGRGISIADSSNNVVSGNNIVATSLKEGMDAISLLASSNIIISENIITNHWAGIELSYSLNCTIYKNTMNGNTYNFGVWGSALSHFLHSIYVSNLVDGKPVYYLVNQKDLVINPSTYPEIGYLALINSTNIQVEGLMLTNNWHSLLLAYTNNSKITYNTIAGARNNGGVVLLCSSNNKIYGNNITDNYCGISLSDSLNNTIASNNITDNDGYGLYLSGSSNNAIHHNNFIKNNEQVSFTDSINIWDDGYPSGGNFWSDYVGVDADADGLGDTPYTIDANNTDRYPLVGSINVFDAGIWDGTAYSVDVVSNSTVSEFTFNPSEGALLRFNVTGDDGTSGFCRVTIPKSLLWVEDGWTVYVGEESVNYTIIPDNDYTYLYFTYNHSIKAVLIQGTHVIPEFPPAIFLPFLMILTMLAVVFAKRRIPRKQKI
jgi:parallel beta-helix repeat protein